MKTVAGDIPTLKQSELPLKLLNRGKVRDIYAVGEDKLLIVVTDRLSAFDVILPDPIPCKGKVLNQISKFWFDYFASVTEHHLITDEVSKMNLPGGMASSHGAQLEGRSMLVKRAKPLPVECVVRGYITGSGWKDYLATGKVCGHTLPKGLKQCGRLPEPLFTPSTKAEVGHDENITEKQMKQLLGEETGEQVKQLSLQIYKKAAAEAKKKGIMIADTKFEFGWDGDKLILIDELLTPDSSRFWPEASYQEGTSPVSFDKQYVRELAERLACNLNKKFKTLSKGNKQKVGLISALMHKPELLIFDEPTSGLDPLVQEEFHAIIREHQAKGGTAFISSHLLSEIQEICDVVGFVREGSLIAVENMSEIAESAPRRIRVVSPEPGLRQKLKELKGIENVIETRTSLTCTYGGDINTLLRTIGNHKLKDLTIQEADLETVFMKFYKG